MHTHALHATHTYIDTHLTPPLHHLSLYLLATILYLYTNNTFLLLLYLFTFYTTLLLAHIFIHNQPHPSPSLYVPLLFLCSLFCIILYMLYMYILPYSHCTFTREGFAFPFLCLLHSTFSTAVSAFLTVTAPLQQLYMHLLCGATYLALLLHTLQPALPCVAYFLHLFLPLPPYTFCILAFRPAAYLQPTGYVLTTLHWPFGLACYIPYSHYGMPLPHYHNLPLPLPFLL